MGEHQFIGLATIIVLGILAQWVAWRLHLPSILLLLVLGVIAGPSTGVLRPDELFGDLLFPLISVSVAIILFEGGLSLKFSELRGGGAVVTKLVTVGILVTWILSAVLARLVGGLEWELAILLGAVLVVSGPTVIIPLLRQVRPAGNIGSIVKWEGIVNDPVGAILAVLVFEVILAGGIGEGFGMAVAGVLKALLFGSGVGLLGAIVMILLLRRYLIPDFLQSSVSVMIVVMAYVAADALQSESGLLAVTVMGIALANQKYVSIKHIVEFKENLRVILISSLFIILAARLPVEEFTTAGISGWILVILLIVLVRPIAVFISTYKSSLPLKEKLFLSWMAPRGIVAAAVMSVFALRLVEEGHAGGAALVPLTFQVIIGTVAVYGLTSPWLARRLKVAKPNPQGILFVGAHRWARDLAEILQAEGFMTALVDTNWQNITHARTSGMRAYYGNVMSENLLFDMQLDGIGRLLAVTPNDDINSLAAVHFVDIFGSSEVYQLPPRTNGKNGKKDANPKHLRGRYLFDDAADFHELSDRVQMGWVFKKHTITEEFGLEEIKAMYGEEALPLIVISEGGSLRVFTTVGTPSVKPGQTLISLVHPNEEATS